MLLALFTVLLLAKNFLQHGKVWVWWVSSLCVRDASDAVPGEEDFISKTAWQAVGELKNTQTGWLGTQSCVGWCTRNQHVPQSTLEVDIPILWNLSSTFEVSNSPTVLWQSVLGFKDAANGYPGDSTWVSPIKNWIRLSKYSHEALPLKTSKCITKIQSANE